MLSGIIVFVAFFLGFLFLFFKKSIDFPVIFSFSVTPVSIGCVLYYAYLLFPERAYNFYRLLLLVVSLLFFFLSFFYYLKSEEKGKLRIDYWFVLPLALSSIIFFFVANFYPDYDPLSYALIGKTIFKYSSLKLYPFVEANVSRPVFSYFYHPPVLPVIYSFLYLFKLNFLMYYVGSYFYLFLNLFVFFFFKKRYGLLAAFFVLVFFAFTPGYVELSRANFTGSLRMLFFAFSLYYISIYSLNSLPVILAGGFALFSHSIGLLVLPALFFAELIKDRKLLFRKHFEAFSLMFFLGGFQYFLNLLKFHALDTRGYLLGFYGKIGEHFINYQFDERHLIGLKERLVNGFFNFVFQFKRFGLSFLISFVFYLFSLAKNVRDNLLVKLSLVFAGIYLFFHFLPVKGGIFIMTYRYIFTIFPVLILGLSPLLKSKKVRLVFYYLVFVNLSLSLLFANPFNKKEFWYKEMKDYISENFTGSEKVLVDHLPSFFFYNDGVRGKELMDPDLYQFYKIKDVYSAVEYLKKEGYTHILMPYRPDPFASDTCVVKIFQYPFLVTALKTYYHCSLFKINYENAYLLKKEMSPIFKWDGKKKIPVFFYKHKKNARGKGGYRFVENGIEVFSENKGFAFAFAKNKVWKRDSCYIALKGEKWIKLKFKANFVSDNAKIFPFLHKKRDDGFSDLGLRWIKKGDFFIALAKSPYFRVYTPFIKVEGVKCIAPGVNFYLSGGKVEIIGLEIEGY